MATQIERNAEVVADLAGSDWQMAYVIACSVEKGKAGRPSGNVRNSGDSKVSIIEFARKVKAAAGGSVYGLGQDGIAARLTKWDEFAAEWDIPLSADLKPEDAKQYPAFPDIPFARQDGAAGDGESNKGKVRDIQNNAKATAAALEDATARQKVIDNMTAAARTALAAEIIAESTSEEVEDIALDAGAVIVKPLSKGGRTSAPTQKERDQKKRETAKRYGLLASQGISKIEGARSMLIAFVELTRDAGFTADEMDAISDAWDRLEAALPLARAAATGQSGTDWDAALAALAE